MSDREPVTAKRPYGRSRRELAEIAIRLFEQSGFEGTTVEEIAARAGYSPRTFFRQFGSKEDVVFFDLPDILSPIEAVANDVDPAHPSRAWAAIRAIVLENSANWEAAGPELAQRRTRMFHDEPALYRRFLEIASDWEAVVARALAAERGAEPATDMYSQALATALVGACRAAFRVWLAAPDLPLARRMEDALELIESGFGLARGG